MMKKAVLFIISLFLCIFLQSAAFSTEKSEFAVKTFKFYESSSDKSGLYNYQPKELRITRKFYKLKSSMKKEYIAVSYTIENKSDNNIRIHILKNGYNPDKAVEKFFYRQNKKRSKTAFLEPLSNAREMFATMFAGDNGLLFFFGLGAGLYYIGIDFPLCIGKSIWNTASYPFYAFNAPKEKAQIEKEMDFFKHIYNKTPKDFLLQPGAIIKLCGIFSVNDPYPYIKALFPDGRKYVFEIK